MTYPSRFHFLLNLDVRVSRDSDQYRSMDFPLSFGALPGARRSQGIPGTAPSLDRIEQVLLVTNALVRGYSDHATAMDARG